MKFLFKLAIIMLIFNKIRIQKWNLTRIQILMETFKISKFKFSNDGRFINLSSDSGCVSVWQIPIEMRENIISVLDEMRRNFRFWDSFRIDYYKENTMSPFKIFIFKNII